MANANKQQLEFGFIVLFLFNFVRIHILKQDSIYFLKD